MPPPIAEPGVTWLRVQDGMNMVYIPAGSFAMGSSSAVSGADPDEFPQHEVTLTAFWIDRTGVTHEQYFYCVRSGQCLEPALISDPAYPVVGVCWDQALPDPLHLFIHAHRRQLIDAHHHALALVATVQKMVDDILGDLFRWIAEGRLTVRIDKTYPLAGAPDAHRYLEGRKTRGKILLLP